MTRLQCKHCPWRVDTVLADIPNGYNAEMHARLARTIAPPGRTAVGPLRLMACHETPPGRELPCVGWLHHQLGPGDNLALRFAVHLKRIDADVQTVGAQHACFEDTLPKGPPQ
jgi:hypothetical protein